MFPIYKVTKLSLQKVLTFFINGKLCFLCVTCSTFITLILLCIRIELHGNYVSKSITVYKGNNYGNHKEQFYVTTMSTRKATKSMSEMMETMPEISEDIVFFNRIPKSGGELLVLLLQWLQDYNGFKHVRLPTIKKYKLSRYEQDDLVQTVKNEVRNGALPFTFDREMYFINFTLFGQQSPMYLSLVRDPIDKAIIRFHYHQVTPTPPLYYSSKLTKSKKKSEIHHLVVKEFEKCVLRNEAICTYSSGKLYDLTIPYFCGHDDRCMVHNERWALNRAKENIERYYPVVGLLEDINTTLSTLQTRLPHFFRGVVDVYEMQLSKKHETREFYRPSNGLNSKVKKILKNQLATEYEFYYYIKKRLYSQHASA